MPSLTWLPVDPDWKQQLGALPAAGQERWKALVALARTDMDFVRTTQLDRRLADTAPAGEPVIRLALLSSATVDQLVPGLRVAALRRGIRLEVHVPDFGQYRQVLLDPASELAAFKPDVVLLSQDARTLVGDQFILDADGARAHVDDAVADLGRLWNAALGTYSCHVIQQAALPVFPALLGNAEHRAPGSPASRVTAFNAAMRVAADGQGVDVLALDQDAAQHGLARWYGVALWHRAKQEISPAASPLYGDLVMRTVAARRGQSSKCLVLDLDNTLWGGVIGDDGLAGIVIGQGSAEGEAYLGFQHYVKALAARGVIIAVCSKNDEANALEAFDKHPEMLLRRGDIAAFVANWDDKAANLRRIAADLNIGVDSLVFADDNPFERNIIRRELPEVAVPELPEDPSLYAQCIADGGWFELSEITPEDLKRGELYQVTKSLRSGDIPATDMAGYLASLEMTLAWGRFDALSQKRVTQLVNKTNQFNLTTRRYTEAEIAAIADDPDAVGFHFRLADRYADHGIIGVVIGRGAPGDDLEIETWLMSCRVLGRGVEQATMAVLAAEARRRGHPAIVGRYIPSAKNNMVRDHYQRLGFAPAGTDGDATLWRLELDAEPAETPHFRILETQNG